MAETPVTLASRRLRAGARKWVYMDGWAWNPPEVPFEKSSEAQGELPSPPLGTARSTLLKAMFLIRVTRQRQTHPAGDAPACCNRPWSHNGVRGGDMVVQTLRKSRTPRSRPCTFPGLCGRASWRAAHGGSVGVRAMVRSTQGGRRAGLGTQELMSPHGMIRTVVETPGSLAG